MGLIPVFLGTIPVCDVDFRITLWYTAGSLPEHGGMGMKLYLTRHGETEGNSLDLACGRTDMDLTARGEEQAKVLSERLPGLGIDLIVSSPLKRAAKTATILNEKIGAPVLYDERLVEIDFGAYELTSRLAPDYLAIRNSFAHRFPGGESTCMVIKRIYEMLDEVKQKYPEKTVLLVTHNVTSKSVNAYCRDVTDEQFHAFRLGNCELAAYEI